MEKRVLYTASTFSHIVNFHLPYLRAFHERGYEVVVACGGAEMEIPYADRTIVLPFEKKMSSPRNFCAVSLLRRELKNNLYTLVSTHTSLAAFFTRLAVMGMGNRPILVNTAHGYLFDGDTPFLKRTVLTGAEKLTAPVTDLLMVMNEWDHGFAVRRRLGKRIVPIPGMGVDFAAMRPVSDEDGQHLRHSLGFSSEQLLLLYAAEFSARKNQSVLLHALAELPAHICLLLPGDGADRAECISLARTLGISDRVVFPGQVTNMPLWYAAADGVAASSRSEGLPFNIMEAMSRGLPVVASAVKGHTDLIEDGSTGLLYPYGDSHRCAEQILRLDRDRELARRLGEQGRAAMEQYDLQKVLPQVMAIYDDLLSRTKRGNEGAKT